MYIYTTRLTSAYSHDFSNAMSRSGLLRSPEIIY